MPERVEVAGKTLRLNGMGLREATILNVKVYVAGLYLETPAGDANRVLAAAQIKRLVLHFLRDVTREQVTGAWTDGFENNNAAKKLAPLRARIQTLNAWMRDFHAGDELTFDCVPGSGVRVAINDAQRGTIAGEDFARGLLSIWLGPEPPNESLKAGLLGKR
jgi:hypothetical protein